MPPLPKKKHSRGRKGKKSSHFGLKRISVGECPQCHSPRLPHRVCTSCGYYNGREVVATESASAEE